MADQEPTTLKEKLKKMRMPVDDINKFLAYVTGERQKEGAAKRRKPDASTPVTDNTDDMLYTMAYKFWNLGLVIDGINVVITGKAMAMVTYHGYKNKVKQTYPTATFDVQLVREGDTFTVAKESGHVIYSHQFGSPFENKPIQGAYCAIKIDDNDYFEALNQRDYKEMQKSSKQGFLWDKWESEFWLKSVIKRACKRHFNDVVAEIDKVDNEDYGAKDTKDVKASDSKKAEIIAAAKAQDDNGS
jgi:recombinational DNA repair protein RecT